MNAELIRLDAQVEAFTKKAQPIVQAVRQLQSRRREIADCALPKEG